MKILISNDDGVFSSGLKSLFDILDKDYQCQVVAPQNDCSGKGHSLTLDRPLYPKLYSNNFFGVNGTPADCVYLALNNVFNFNPDIVLSGINLGANLGDDILYSGTVAAAREGRSLKYPSIAFSIDSYEDTNMKTAAIIAFQIVKNLHKLKINKNTILNVNIPNLPINFIKGIQFTRLGLRTKSNRPLKILTPKNKEYFWVGTVGDPLDRDKGTDFYAVQNGFVSITPILLDQTDYGEALSVNDWLQCFNS